MIKRISLLTRKPELSREEFSDYWLNVHGPMVERLPNVIRYVQNHITDDAHRHDLEPYGVRDEQREADEQDGQDDGGGIELRHGWKMAAGFS